MRAYFYTAGDSPADAFLTLDLHTIPGIMHLNALLYGKTVQKITRYLTEASYYYEGGLVVLVRKDDPHGEQSG